MLSSVLTQHVQDVALPVAAILAGTIVFTLFARSISLRLKHSPADVEFWDKLDTIGVASKGSLLSWIPAILGSFSRTVANVQQGYDTFCKTGDRPFALPTLWTGGAVVVLPPTMLHLLNRPDSQLAAVTAQLESVQLPYMFKDKDIYHNTIHFDAVRRSMAPKNLDAMAADAAEEIDLAFRKYWDTDAKGKDGWSVLNNWHVCGKVVTRVAMRGLIGASLCQDDTLMGQLEMHGNAIILGSAVINCMPPVVRPWLGPLMGVQTKYHQAKCVRILVPHIEERIRAIVSGEPIDEQVSDAMCLSQTSTDCQLQHDFLHVLIARCAKAGLGQLDPSKIAMRILALSTMSFLGIAYVFAHSILDLYGSTNRKEFIEGLEQECRRVDAELGGLNSSEAIGKLHRVESAMKESMRISDFSATNLSRDVVAQEFDLGNGMKLPRGVRVVFPTYPIHHDSSFYPDPTEYDAFRFSREQEVNPEAEPSSMTAQDRSFLVFGYGKHACPGRWYAAQVMKQMLAYVVMNYDVEVLGTRPRRQAMLNIIMPPTQMQLRVRRKGL